MEGTGDYGGWPKSGEIDILESHGNNRSCRHGRHKVSSHLHFGVATPKNLFDGYRIGSRHYYEMDDGYLSDDFHVYDLAWTPEQIDTYIDGTLMMS